MYGERIRKLRKERGMTLRDLSDALGIPFTTLGNYEREDRQPNFETFQVIADYFNVSIDFLAGRRGEKTSEEYIFRKGTDQMKDQLIDAPPEIREKIVDIYDTIYLLTDRRRNKDDVEQLKHISEIISFLLKMKDRFFLHTRTDLPNDDIAKYEYAKEFNKRKIEVDKHFYALFEKYAEEKSLIYKWDFEE
ncbi:helix-turn-helix domain-containing protein [Priestia endophytica]